MKIVVGRAGSGRTSFVADHTNKTVSSTLLVLTTDNHSDAYYEKCNPGTVIIARSSWTMSNIVAEIEKRRVDHVVIDVGWQLLNVVNLLKLEQMYGLSIIFTYQLPADSPSGLSIYNTTCEYFDIGYIKLNGGYS